MTTDVFILGGARTPMADYTGKLKDFSAIENEDICSHWFAVGGLQFAVMTSPASRVPSLPPISGVTWFSFTAFRIAASMAAASLARPSVSIISAADAIAPIGFATFFPANFGGSRTMYIASASM